jgi:hypothetical protein
LARDSYPICVSKKKYALPVGLHAQVCFASVTNSYQAKFAWLIILCSGRRRDIIALFASDFLKTNTNVIHQAERTDVQ